MSDYFRQHTADLFAQFLGASASPAVAVSLDEYRSWVAKRRCTSSTRPLGTRHSARGAWS